MKFNCKCQKHSFSNKKYSYWELWCDLDVTKDKTKNITNLNSIYVNFTYPVNSLDADINLGIIGPKAWSWGATYTPNAPALPVNLEFCDESITKPSVVPFCNLTLAEEPDATTISVVDEK